ncbi:MAG: nitrite/sulfite reductase [Acidimicrobiales bacterium]
MPRSPELPVGVEQRGKGRGLRFVKPYRWIGELNPIERAKLERHPFEVASAIVERYAAQGAASIHEIPGEQERLKWVGLYPQVQGGNAFMMRVKVPGGVLQAAQAREIGIAAEAFAEGPEDSSVFGNRYADITTRQSIQLHWVHIEDVPRMWQRFADVGITTVQACGDCARNVTCCPVSGVDAGETIDALPVARAISDFFTGNWEYANLPRKFKIGVTGCHEDCARVEIDDVGLWPARAADGTIGFNVLAGGGLSDGERMASDIDVFVRPDQAVELVRAIAQVYGELGNREHRGLARMRYLVQELGTEGFRAELERRASIRLEPAGEELTTRQRGDHVGVHPARTPGTVYVGCSVPVGRLRGIDLVEAARLAESYGDGTVRLTPNQNFVLAGVPERRVDELLAEPLLAKYSPFPGPFTRGVVTCTGSEFCRFAVVETKERAVRLARTLDARLASGGTDGAAWTGEDVLRIHLSGCSASCAQPQIADIGLRGEIAHVGDRIEEAVDVGLGGSLGPDAGFIRWIAGRLPATELADAIARVAVAYRDGRRDAEPFHAWARRHTQPALRTLVEGHAAATEAIA